jgi:signal transduction histidine kinase
MPTAPPSSSHAPAPGEELECVSHPGVVAHLLMGLGGNDSLDAETRRLIFLDPALSLHALRLIASRHPQAQLSGLHLPALVEELGAHALKHMALAGAIHQLRAGPERNASLDVIWRQAVTGAALTRILAEAQGYRNLEEAWLAGLLAQLPSFVRNAPSPQAARLACLAHLERLPLRSFLPDVLRYLEEPAERLQDAAPLVRHALAAHRLLPALSRGAPAAFAPPADGVFLSHPLSTDALKDMLQNAQKTAEQLTDTIQAIPATRVATEVVRFGRLETAAGQRNNTLEAAVAALATGLTAEEGLYDPIYLALNKRTSTLEARPLADAPAPAISLRVEGSNTAAVRALFTRSCVVAYAADRDTALLDSQIIRQAGAEGLAALPVGEGGNRGVLLICGDRDALEKLAADPRHYTRLGELAGDVAATPDAPVTPAPAAPLDEGLPNRVRRAAHEVNNPLGIIKNYLAILKTKMGDDAPVSDELRIIHEELDRIVRIVRGMLHEDAELGDLRDDTDINVLIEDMVKVTAPTWHAKGVRVEPLLSPGLPRLAHDRDKLKQIILNLLLNALEASPPGSVVRLETATVTNHQKKHFLEILVADKGSGIPAERMDALFDPVETDKGEGHAGLGLSIVKSLTESLEGSITLKSGPGGTTFQISLPLG